jgi:hypothetical protein
MFLNGFNPIQIVAVFQYLFKEIFVNTVIDHYVFIFPLDKFSN